MPKGTSNNVWRCTTVTMLWAPGRAKHPHCKDRPTSEGYSALNVSSAGAQKLH